MQPSTPAKLPLDKLIDLMNTEHQRVAQAIASDYAEQFAIIPGAEHKHQSWPGGYLSHIEEAMNIGIMLYEGLGERRPLDFAIGNLLFCIYLHDFDKLQRYIVEADGSVSRKPYSDGYLNKTKTILAQRYHYNLTDEEYNALQYAHGEGDDHNPTKRVMLPMATLVHCADVISARVWHDFGHNSDSWDN